MTLPAFLALERQEKKSLLLSCCGSQAWVEKMLASSLPADIQSLVAYSSAQWHACSAEDWREAFSHHPKIGDREALREKFVADPYAAKEQSGVTGTSEEILESLAAANHAYEQKFGYIFIICATGKSAKEMLEDLTARLANDPGKELHMAMKEQDKITSLRLKKLFDQ